MMAPESTMQQRLRTILEEEWYRSSPDMTWIRFRKAIARYIDVHGIGDLSRAPGFVGLDSTRGGSRVWPASGDQDELQSRHSPYSIGPSATTYYVIGAAMPGTRSNQKDEEVITLGFDPLLPTWGEMRHRFGVRRDPPHTAISAPPPEGHLAVEPVYPKSTPKPTDSEVVEELLTTVPWGDEVREFYAGFEGKCPSPETVSIANQLVWTAKQRAAESDIYVDDTDGALGLMLRLDDGLLLLAELSLDGVLSGGTYDDGNGEGKQVEFIANATVGQMLDLL